MTVDVVPKADRARWLHLSYAYSVLVAAILGYFLLRIPIQLTDSFFNLVALDQSFADLMRAQLADREYLRPGLWAELKLVYDLSGGNYFYWFRMTQVLQAALTIVLFVRLLQPRSGTAASVVPLALAVLVGSHTFAWTLREAFPINTFLTIVLCCVTAANLAFAQRRWWTDVAAIVLFVVAASTVESGLLVGVLFIGGYLIGLRGVSRGAVLAIGALFVTYFVVRFLVLDVGVPGLMAREAGFGFARRDGAELTALFGDSPLGFYAYNVVASLLNVLVAEPRDGVWRLVRGLTSADIEPPMVVGALATALATALVCRFAWRRRHEWMSRRFERDDQLVLLFVLMLAANAAICYAYTKDVIMSPAGVFFAAAVFVSVCDLVARPPRGAGQAIAVVAVVGMLSTLWAVRAVGLHAALAASAGSVREQWAYVDEWLERSHNEQLSPRARALKQHLQDDAVIRHPARPPLREKWTRLFEVE
ncbi:MAG TPA: hypothetical protein VIX63_13805 [Vicinamibacterales bacterium]